MSIEKVCELRNCEWNEVTEIGVIEFLNQLAYLKDREKEREKQIEDMKKNVKKVNNHG